MAEPRNALDLRPLCCAACGAPVVLENASSVTCPYCAASVPVPEPYRTLWAAAECAREARRRAEAQYKRMLASALPEWVWQIHAKVLSPAMALGIPITFAVTQSTYHWGPRHWVMLAGVIPNTVNILVAVMLWARSIPCALGDKASSRLHPAPRRDGHIGFECGLCDAPLRLEPDALAATCDYCAADNWLSGDHAVAQRRANEKREMRALQELIESDERQRADIRLLIIVSAIVCTLAFAGLWFALPVSV